MSWIHRVSIAVLTSSATVAALGAAPGWAGAPEEPKVVASGLAGPLQLDVGHRGQIYTGQSFAGLLTRIGRNGNQVTLTSEPASVSGVASRRWSVAYTVRGDDPANPLAQLKLRRANGQIRIVADLAAYEAAHNPDAGNRYGFRGLSADCLAQLPPDFQPYTGQVDSNPYALLNVPGGWLVADAGANAILKVTKRGRVSTFFVFRPQKATVSAEVAASFGLPDCVAGKTFAFEPVPTDIEQNAGGYFFSTLLPGGPEDASLGARGALIRFDADGEFSNLASGFLGATNLAIGRGGRIYVAELFGNQISMFRHGTVTPVRSLPSPAGVEYSRGRLVVSTDVFGDGTIVSFAP